MPHAGSASYCSSQPACPMTPPWNCREGFPPDRNLMHNDCVTLIMPSQPSLTHTDFLPVSQIPPSRQRCCTYRIPLHRTPLARSRLEISLDLGELPQKITWRLRSTPACLTAWRGRLAGTGGWIVWIGKGFFNLAFQLGRIVRWDCILPPTEDRGAAQPQHWTRRREESHVTRSSHLRTLR